MKTLPCLEAVGAEYRLTFATIHLKCEYMYMLKYIKRKVNCRLCELTTDMYKIEKKNVKLMSLYQVVTCIPHIKTMPNKQKSFLYVLALQLYIQIHSAEVHQNINNQCRQKIPNQMHFSVTWPNISRDSFSGRVKHDDPP